MKLGEQWIEIIDGQEHMVKCVGIRNPVIAGGNNFITKDLGILRDGLLPCPFCGEYPESFNKGNEYTKKRCSVMKCKKCNYELTVCAIYKTIDWCKQRAIAAWNRRA